MRPGISLLDVMVSIAIGSVISLLLYRSLEQTNRVVRTVDALIDTHTERALFTHQCANDLEGVFVPLEVLAHATKPSKTLDQKNPQEKKSPEKESTEKTKKTDTLTHVFFLQDMAKDTSKSPGSNAVLTFITSNPLAAYGEAGVRKVRVSYQLKSQEKGSSLAVLMRYESPEIDYKKFQENQKSHKITGYPILRNIQSLTIECGIDDEKEKKSEKKAGSRKRKESEKFELVDTWDDMKRREDKKTLMPDFVKIHGIVTDNRKKKEVSFDSIIPIMTSNLIQEQEEPAETGEKQVHKFTIPSSLVKQMVAPSKNTQTVPFGGKR